jgi:ferric-dicitrate binding protein FerR (iron transport regulator)
VVAYGRWRGRTLRLVNGEVAIMGDDHAFRPLVTQTPDCVVGASR